MEVTAPPRVVCGHPPRNAIQHLLRSRVPLRAAEREAWRRPGRLLPQGHPALAWRHAAQSATRGPARRVCADSALVCLVLCAGGLAEAGDRPCPRPSLAL